jgi:hypothetical protein
MIRRRQNIRFLITIGVIVVCVFFFLMLTQFSSIENETYSQKNYRNDRQGRMQNIHEKVGIKHPGRFAQNRLDDASGNYDRNNDLAPEGEEWRIEVRQSMSSMQKLVHLDLKGSPPKLNYLKELIPYFKSIGATGVLIEYEDFFPYQNELEAIRNQNHYTNSELKHIFDLLAASKLSAIPLIQTYGHLEYVLKLKQYAYLREDSKHFNVITPCLNETYEKIIFRMIDQILDVHPEDMQYIHIGCDEVYFVGINAACKSMGLNSFQEYFIQ